MRTRVEQIQPITKQTYTSKVSIQGIYIDKGE